MRQLDKTKRRLCIGAFAVVAAPLLLASVASACTQLKNLQTNSTSGAAGVTLQVTGTNFNKTGANAVEIRMDSRSSAPIATLDVTQISATGGVIAMTVVIPASAAMGYHTLLATQTSTAPGAPLMSGFPVRAAYKVTAVAAGRAGDAGSAPAAAEPVSSPAATQTAPASAASAAPASASVSTAPSATSGAAAVPAAAASVIAAVPAAEATRTGAVDPAAGSTAATSAAGPASAAPAAVATPSLGAAPAADRSTVVSSGLVAAASRRSASALPGLTFALGAAMVLLSLAAFVKSGRSVVGGRLTTLA